MKMENRQCTHLSVQEIPARKLSKLNKNLINVSNMLVTTGKIHSNLNYDYLFLYECDKY
jgi:hypothetical protein